MGYKSWLIENIEDRQVFIQGMKVLLELIDGQITSQSKVEAAKGSSENTKQNKAIIKMKLPD